MKALTLISLVLLALHAGAHARLKTSAGVTPRSANAGIKSGPCGPNPRLAMPPTVIAGSKLTVYWEETVNHPGRFEFYFSKAGMQNFVLLKTVPDTQDGGGLPHQYSTVLDLPTEPCADCTLQMIQVMTENPTNPSLYYSCADMITVPDGQMPSPTPTPTPSGTPEPVEPTEPCH